MITENRKPIKDKLLNRLLKNNQVVVMWSFFDVKADDGINLPYE